jgi:hypothetical protein
MKIFRLLPFLVLVALLLPADRAAGVEHESGPAFFTDLHGAGGVTWFLSPMKHEKPAYERLYYGGLDWLVDRAEWHNGRCVWILSTTAPPGHENHRYITGQGGIMTALIDGFFETGRREYRDTAIGALRSLRFGAIWSMTPYGPACYWGKRVGHGRGPGQIGNRLVSFYSIHPDPMILLLIEGLLNWIRSEAVVSTTGQGETVVMWPTIKGGTGYSTGYCRGNAGTLAFLIGAAEQFPTFSWKDGITIRDLVNANLRWFNSIAIDVPIPNQAQKGIIWPYMRLQKLTNNAGWGSGVSGIGAQFMRAYTINNAVGAPFADICLDIAKRAALTTVFLLKINPTFKRGACGGEGGIHYFLLDLADLLDTIPDPALAAACRDATAGVADRIVSDSLRFKGRTTWRADTKFGLTASSIAYDYGSSGLANSLYEIGRRLNRSDFLDKGREAAEFIRLITVWDQKAGCKWPMIVPFGIDSDRDGVCNDWDRFPNNENEANDTDGDGMGDLFEWLIVDDDLNDPITGFGTVLPGENYDGDPYTNLEEFQNGTDPTTPDP